MSYSLINIPSGTDFLRSCRVPSMLPGLRGRVLPCEARQWLWQHRVALSPSHAGPGPLRKPFASALPPRAARVTRSLSCPQGQTPDLVPEKHFLTKDPLDDAPGR